MFKTRNIFIFILILTFSVLILLFYSTTIALGSELQLSASVVQANSLFRMTVVSTRVEQITVTLPNGFLFRATPKLGKAEGNRYWVLSIDDERFEFTVMSGAPPGRFVIGAIFDVIGGEPVEVKQEIQVEGPVGAAVEVEAEAEAEVPVSGPRVAVTETLIRLRSSGSVEVVLSEAPQGLRAFDFTVFIRSESNRAVVGLAGLEPGVIDGQFFEQVRRGPTFATFRGVDFSDRVRAGAQGVRLAKLILNGVFEGTATVAVTVNIMVDDLGASITSAGVPGQVQVVQILPIGDHDIPPQDLDEDGRFEDIDGDGQLTRRDAISFAFNLGDPEIKVSPKAFDFDGNGQVEFSDAITLATATLGASRVEEPPVTVMAVRFFAHPDHTRIVYDLSNEPDPEIMAVSDPPRIVVALGNAQLAGTLDSRDVPVGSPEVTRVRYQLQETGVRLIAELNGEHGYRLFTLTDPYRIVIDVGI
ncbi:MAG: AMIN domain-containing protein [Candidatus Bipolaricaulia bacterium]